MATQQNLYDQLVEYQNDRFVRWYSTLIANIIKPCFKDLPRSHAKLLSVGYPGQGNFALLAAWYVRSGDFHMKMQEGRVYVGQFPLCELALKPKPTKFDIPSQWSELVAYLRSLGILKCKWSPHHHHLFSVFVHKCVMKVMCARDRLIDRGVCCVPPLDIWLVIFQMIIA